MWQDPEGLYGALSLSRALSYIYCLLELRSLMRSLPLSPFEFWHAYHSAASLMNVVLIGALFRNPHCPHTNEYRLLAVQTWSRLMHNIYCLLEFVRCLIE